MTFHLRAVMKNSATCQAKIINKLNKIIISIQAAVVQLLLSPERDNCGVDLIFDALPYNRPGMGWAERARLLALSPERDHIPL